MYSKSPHNTLTFHGEIYYTLPSCIEEHLYHRAFNDQAHPEFYWHESFKKYLEENALCEIDSLL